MARVKSLENIHQTSEEAAARASLVGSRVDQLDALELDEQLFMAFRNQLSYVFKYFESSNLLTSWSAEVDALVRAALLSVLLLGRRYNVDEWSKSATDGWENPEGAACAQAQAPATVGQSLLGLSLVDASEEALLAGLANVKAPPLHRWKLVAIILLTAGTRWFRERVLIRILRTFTGGDLLRAERYATVGEAVVRIAGVVNFFVFLVQNRYPNLLYRLLGLRLRYERPPSPRRPDYDSMSRELLWTTFTELIGFVLPLVNAARNRALLRNAFRKAVASSPLGLFGRSSANILQENSREVLPAEASSIHQWLRWLKWPRFSCHTSKSGSVGGMTASNNCVLLGVNIEKGAERELIPSTSEHRGTFSHQRTLADFKTCAICSKMPTHPHEIGCRHVFCYFCISANVLDDNQFECPQCGRSTLAGIRSVVPATIF